jgi:hypothetical protein
MAAAQVRYNDAKSSWLKAIERAQSEKDKARADYDREKADGDTDASFTQWVATNVRLKPFSTCMLY